MKRKHYVSFALMLRALYIRAHISEADADAITDAVTDWFALQSDRFDPDRFRAVVEHGTDVVGAEERERANV